MIKFEKVSLDQFSKDYIKCKGWSSDRELSEDEAKEIIQVWENIKLPKRSTKYSAGYDFYIPYKQFFPSTNAILIPTGIRFKCDDDKFLMCVPRSGLGFKYQMRLANSVGIIDKDYYDSSNEGHIMCKVCCSKDFTLEEGKALMQGIILPYFKIDDDNSDEVRDGGFGSTGM